MVRRSPEPHDDSAKSGRFTIPSTLPSHVVTSLETTVLDNLPFPATNVPVVEQLAETQELSEAKLPPPLNHSSRRVLLAQHVRLPDGPSGLRANLMLVLGDPRGNPEKRSLPRCRGVEVTLDGVPWRLEIERATVACAT